MRRFLVCCTLVGLLATLSSAHAAAGRVIKVLPLFLDLDGKSTVSPSLYERDAYQFQLRQHPEKRCAIRFAIQWKAHAAVGPVTLRIELRGSAPGSAPTRMTIEKAVKPDGGWFGQWTDLLLDGEDYKDFGELIAWRASLWENDWLLGEQKSFLWQ
jgi:hypothetical protein